MRLDALDAGILRLLQEDARRSFRDLAGRLGSTTPTISARVRALEELGILRGYRAEVDPDALGGALHAVTVRARPAAAERVAAQLAVVPGVEEVLLLAGGALWARMRARPPGSSLGALHAALAAMEEVQGYEVGEVLRVAHRAPLALGGEGVEVACHQCRGPIPGAPFRGAFGGRAHVFCCAHCLATFKARHATLAAQARGALGPGAKGQARRKAA